MNEELQEEIDFWNDFSEEYTLIQAESEISIVADLKTYLASSITEPVETLVDLAGGSGKYIPALSQLTQTYHLIDFSKEMVRQAKEQYPEVPIHLQVIDQASFLKETADQTYDILFSAMNPAIQTKEDLAELLRVSKKYVYILRVIEEEETLFSPYEAKNEALNLMACYKEWLEVPFTSHLFTYVSEEVITKDFFREYFIDELPRDVLEQALECHFLTKETAINQKVLTFELLSIER